MQFFANHRILHSNLQYFYTLLMITFLSTTQLYSSNNAHLTTHDIFPMSKMPYAYTSYDTGHFPKKITPELRCVRKLTCHEKVDLHYTHNVLYIYTPSTHT